MIVLIEGPSIGRQGDRLSLMDEFAVGDTLWFERVGPGDIVARKSPAPVDALSYRVEAGATADELRVVAQRHSTPLQALGVFEIDGPAPLEVGDELRTADAIRRGDLVTFARVQPNQVELRKATVATPAQLYRADRGEQAGSIRLTPVAVLIGEDVPPARGELPLLDDDRPRVRIGFYEVDDPRVPPQIRAHQATLRPRIAYVEDLGHAEYALYNGTAGLLDLVVLR